MFRVNAGDTLMEGLRELPKKGYPDQGRSFRYCRLLKLFKDQGSEVAFVKHNGEIIDGILYRGAKMDLEKWLKM